MGILRQYLHKSLVMGLAIGLSIAVARADILVRTDGGLLDGKVQSQDAKEIVFQPDGAEASAAQRLDRAGVARVLIADEHGALKSDSSAPATQPASRWNVPAEPTAPPIAPAGTKPTYLVIPLHGEVGETILAGALEKSLADAVARKPTVVILEIDSPGGMVEEAKQIIEVLHRYNKKLRIVALTNQDLSAAAVFSLSVREIYVKSSSTIGAATSFIPNNLMLPPKIEEKMQSAWRAVARNSAEEGGHQPLLAEAMIDNDHELHIATVGGKHVVKEGVGDNTLCRKGKILTLTSHEAIACGLAKGEADDAAELGAALKYPNWKEIKGLGVLLADSLPKRVESFKAEQEKIITRFQQDMMVAGNADPTDSVTSTRVTRVPTQTVRPAGPGRQTITHGTHTETVTVTRQRPPARWKPDSLACVVALQRCEIDLKDAMSLSVAYGRSSEVESIKEISDKIAAVRATIYDNRNKFGQGEIVATNAPAGNAPAGNAPPNPTAAPGPVRRVVSMPPGTLKTAVVGGKGGSGYITIFKNNYPAVGFRYILGEWGGKKVMKDIGPVSIPHNTPGPQVHEVLAKDGYVVGGLIVDADDTNIVAFKIIFVGFKDGQVDLKEKYESDWQGTPDDNSPKTLAGNGEVILGTIGRRGMNQDAMGLIVVPPGGKIPPPPVAAEAPKPN